MILSSTTHYIDIERETPDIDMGTGIGIDIDIERDVRISFVDFDGSFRLDAFMKRNCCRFWRI